MVCFLPVSFELNSQGSKMTGLNALNNKDILLNLGDKPSKQLQEQFLKLQKQAKRQEVNLENAKQFLQKLDTKALELLQKYHQLPGKIDAQNISDEGAYNLLLSAKNQADFDKDGNITVADKISLKFPPMQLSEDLKSAFNNILKDLHAKGAKPNELYQFSFTIFESDLKSKFIDETAKMTKNNFFGSLDHKMKSLVNELETNPSKKTTKTLELAKELQKSFAQMSGKAGDNFSLINKNIDKILQDVKAYENLGKRTKI